MIKQLLTIVGCLFLGIGTAQTDIGQIKNVSGEVSIMREGVRLPVQVGDRLEQNDIIATGSDGSVGMTFIDNTRFSAGPDSRIELSRFRFNSTTHEGEFLANIRKGTLAVTSGQIAKQSPDAMKVTTPTSVLAVRGTKFLIKVND